MTSPRDLLPVRPAETVSMRTRDGVRMDADLWRPDAPGRYPVLLMRQPYGRRIASSVVYAHPRWYAAQGYLVVIQDVRGAGTSEGEFGLYAQEPADGADAVAWAASLEGSTGVVGMYGFSYQGMTQLMALAERPAALKALAPCMVAWDLYADRAYEQGAFQLAANAGWAFQLAALQAQRDGDAELFAKLAAAGKGGAFDGPLAAYPALLRPGASRSYYDDWIRRPKDDPYWAANSPAAQIGTAPLDVPMLHIGGWFDGMLTGTLAAWAAIRAMTTAPQALVIGPWVHLGWGQRLDGSDFGPGAISDIDRRQLAWFDQFLKGGPPSFDAEHPVELFDLGTKSWAKLPAWPEPTPTALYLDSTGLAGVRLDDGRLNATAPEAAGSTTIVNDPWRPVPSLGGPYGPRHGMANRADLDQRFDVACFTSEPFERETKLAGAVTAELWVEADCPSFDVSAVLSIVTPEGNALTLTQGHCRVDAEGLVKLALKPTFVTVAAGQRLRLSLAGASFPGFAVNPGTRVAPAEAARVHDRIITLILGHGGDRAARMLLPIG